MPVICFERFYKFEKLHGKIYRSNAKVFMKKASYLLCWCRQPSLKGIFNTPLEKYCKK